MVPIGQIRYTNEVCGWWGKKVDEACYGSEARVENAIKGVERND
jgi:hypothetical protein